jgi:PKD repeat protein
MSRCSNLLARTAPSSPERRPRPRFPRSVPRAAVSAVFAIVLLCAGASAATFQVNVGQGGSSFVDQTSGTNTTTIHVGDTVQWVWTANTHSTTSGTCTSGGYYGGDCTPDQEWDSGQNPAPHTFKHTFSEVGSFNYYCSIHMAMMQGVVVVEKAAENPPSASLRFAPTGPIAGTMVHFTDMSTGSPTSWSWNFGDTASGSANTSTARNPSHAFSVSGTYTVTLSVTNAGGTATSSEVVAVAPGESTTCVPDVGTMCLNNNRFRVTAAWQKTDGSSGAGTAVALTSDSGYFWFFDPSNIEMVTKVLGACGLDGNYWVFAAGLTNVKVTLTVLDTSNGISEQYVNPLNASFQPIQDTGAFATCP